MNSGRGMHRTIARFTTTALCAALIVLTASAPLYAVPQTIHFKIDRTAVPSLYYNDLTLKVKACGATTADVRAGSVTVPDTIVNGWVIFTTTADSVVVFLNDPTSIDSIGTFTKAALKNDKKWAWSHSLDDNSGLSDEIAAFKSRGYRTLSFLIGNNTDASQISADCNYGNHSMSHNTVSGIGGTEPAKTDIRACQTKITGLIAPKIPNYKVIAFASPMFDGAFGPIIRTMAKAKDTDLQYCESGNYWKMRVDPNSSAYYGFVVYSPNIDIGRYDFCAPWPTYTPDWAGFKAAIDSMHLGANDTRHFWYNTFNHGGEDNNNLIPKAVAYVDTAYADHGTKEAWIAPSDEIYSFITIRNKAVVTNDRTTDVTGHATALHPVTARAIRHVEVSKAGQISIQTAASGTLSVFNMLGDRMVAFDVLTAGMTTTKWQARSGNYFVRFDNGLVREVVSVFVR